ncbi:MAG: RNA polymerase factor sigma-54 [Chitinophagales bacterium]
MLKQHLSQKLLQKLSPQQIQLMKLLQVPTAQLDQRIKEEIEINPALEVAAEEEAEFDQQDEVAENLNDTTEETETDDFSEQETDTAETEELDMSEYYDEDDEQIADYKTRDPNEFPDPDDDNKTIPVAIRSTFHDYLEEQLGLLDLDERLQQIAFHLIGSLDDDGYLRRELDAVVDDLAFSQNITTNENELAAVLEQIQKLDPPGVGARTLEECLLIQLRRKEQPTPYTATAIKVIEKYFDAFAKKHYDRLEKAFDLKSEDLRKVLDEITHLNPRPGNAFGGGMSGQQLVIPDYLISNNNGELVLTLNSANAPELRISSSFRDMISDYKKSKVKSRDQKEALLFIKQKIDSAKWFIDAIRQRQHTMLITMQAILNIQYDFFVTGDETRLKPMILKDIAERTGLDISTVSRVANSKYVQTEFGTFLLKFFFSEALTNDEGEEVSTREVKKILSDVIGAEDKSDPLSDQKLMEILQQRGYNIARRTVAKYREQLNLPVARLRKEL